MSVIWTLSKHQFDVESIQNMHRFDLIYSSETIRTQFPRTQREIELKRLLSKSGVKCFYPRYQLNVLNASWKLEEPNPNSYVFWSYLDSKVNEQYIIEYLSTNKFFKEIVKDANFLTV
jgi:hypothetical protein